MQPKFLIIFAIVSIAALAIFNVISSHRTEEVIAANQSSNISASVTAATPLGKQPKEMLDKANAGINQANQENANKMAEAEKATQ